VASGSVIARIITQYSDKGSKAAQRDITKLGKQFDAFANKAVKSVGLIGIALGGMAAKIIVDGTKAAIEAEAAQTRLQKILLNTAGATEQQIESLNKQAKALEQVGVVSAGTTTIVQSQLATFDLSASVIEKLTPAILDYVVAEKGATASTDDFKSMTNGLAQALQGNFASLTRTGFVLDEATKKTIASGTATERAAALVDVLNSTYKDFNITARGTAEGQLVALRNAFDGIKESIGFAVLPILGELVDKIQKEIVPALEAWVSENKDQVVASLKTVVKQASMAAEVIFKFFKVIKDNFQTVKNLAAILTGLFVAGKVYAGIVAITAAITALRIAFGLQAAAAGTAAVATAAATGGANLVAAAGALAVFAATTGVALVALNGTGKATKEVANQTDKLGAIERANAKERGMLASRNFKIVKDTVTTTGAGITAAKKLTAEEKKRLEVKKAIKKAGLDEFGIRNVSTTDAISLEAARLNLVKEGSIAELKRFDLMVAFNIEQARLNDLTKRYADILAVVADSRVSDEEVALLAAKWGISTAAVIEYIAKVTNAPLPAGWNTPGDNAATGWQTALAALNAYYAALGVTPKVNVPGSVVIPKQDPIITPQLTNEQLVKEAAGYVDEFQRIADAQRFASGAASTPSFSMMADTGDDIFNRDRTTGQLTINVTGTGGLSDETKREVVNAVVEASGSGYSTNWFRTTGGGEGILFT
jgi:hypothetical protein